jgi:hypothetical protein
MNWNRGVMCSICSDPTKTAENFDGDKLKVTVASMEKN